MKALTFAVFSFLVVACTSPSPPKEVTREASPTVSVTSEPEATAPDLGPGSSKGATTNGEACGDVTCPAGQVCCNPSCGICTPPDGACIQMVCEKKDASTAEPRPHAPRASACTTDDDCRTHSIYCQDRPCSCVALGRGEAAPRCSGPAVNCFVDPCIKRIARCEAGACVLASH